MEAMSTVRTSRTVIEYTGSPLDNFSLAWLRSRGVASLLMWSGSSTTRGVFAEQRRERARLVLEPVDRLDLQVLARTQQHAVHVVFGGVRRQVVEKEAARFTSGG